MNSSSLQIDRSRLSSAGQTQDEVSIEPFNATPNTVFWLSFQVSHLTKNISYMSKVQVTYLQSDLVAFIEGGSRMSGYSQALEISSQVYDPDQKDDQQGRLTIDFQCMDLKTGGACQDVQKKNLVLNTTSDH